MRSIAILGATSHIAKNLIVRFDDQIILNLFCRNSASMSTFLQSERPLATVKVKGYDDFLSGSYDVIINCVGVADPKKQKTDPYESFIVTERFDNLSIEYLTLHPEVKYIYFSSGAIFGTEFVEPVFDGSVAAFSPNSLVSSDFYRISKLNSEAKHRCLASLFIVDIRVFSFFSRFIDLNAGFMLSEATKCLLEKQPFVTNSVDVVRDYISPDDLYDMLMYLLSTNFLNTAFDAQSLYPVRKSELIELLTSKYGLVVSVHESDLYTVSGKKSEYYSKSEKATKMVGIPRPQFSSLTCVDLELAALLSTNKQLFSL